jgi:hypothetical protein
LETAEGIDFGHQVAFADTSNGRVAWHLCDRATIKGHYRHQRTHTGGRGRRLTARMAGTYDHDIDS